MKRIRFGKAIATCAICAAFVCTAALAGCGQTAGNPSGPENENETSAPAADESALSDVEADEAAADTLASDIDYMVLVNKQNPLPHKWEDNLEYVTVKNSHGEDAIVEKSAYEAFCALQEELAEKGVDVGIDMAYISVKAQQQLVDELAEAEGEDYAKKHEETPGLSEHHTALAIDLSLRIDGEELADDESRAAHPEIWEKVAAKLAGYGFIQRYPAGKEDITGYDSEPWHIRYIGDVEVAEEIAAKNLTLEEYLGVADEAREANAKAKAEEEAAEAERIAAQEAAEAEEAAEEYYYDDSQYYYGDTYSGADYSSSGIYQAEYSDMYNDDGPSHTMPGWYDGYLETYYNASGHYLADTWTLDDEGFYHDENGRYVVGVDVSHMDDMPYGTVIETGKGEAVVYDYGSGAEVHDFATNW